MACFKAPNLIESMSSSCCATDVEVVTFELSIFAELVSLIAIADIVCVVDMLLMHVLPHEEKCRTKISKSFPELLSSELKHVSTVEIQQIMACGFHLIGTLVVVYCRPWR